MIVQPDFLDHWKTQMLVDLTGDPASPLMILRLWAHCQQRRTARFTGLAPSALKAICRAGALEANKLRSILLQCGFLRVEGDLTIVHDWAETNAALLGSWENGKKGGRPRQKSKRKPPDNNGFFLENPRDTHGQPGANPEGTDKRRVEKSRSEHESSDAPEAPPVNNSPPSPRVPNGTRALSSEGDSKFARDSTASDDEVWQNLCAAAGPGEMRRCGALWRTRHRTARSAVALAVEDLGVKTPAERAQIVNPGAYLTERFTYHAGSGKQTAGAATP